MPRKRFISSFAFIATLLVAFLFFSQSKSSTFAANPPVHQETVSVTGYATSSLTTPTIQGGTNQLYLVSISSHKNINVTNVTGLGLTWTEIKAQCGSQNLNGTEIWRAFGSPGGGTVTVTFGASAI